MHGGMESILLDDLGALRFTGADAARFLQGQVSSDVMRLAAEPSLLAGYHNPQGRTLALLRLIQLAPGDILALLPRELAQDVARRLSKFILRSNVKLADVSERFNIHGLVAADDAEPSAPQAGTTLVRLADAPARWLKISPVGDAVTAHGDRQRWRSLDIAGGLPQVYTATSEEFVAQMLNLDALGAIDFDKGCYTGQEVIARAHYRGRVKRRMQRFATQASHGLRPGASGRLADGRSFKVVDAVVRGDGRCEFLAVTALEARDEAQADAASAPIETTALPLPYSLPE
jgi:tRNA-modifying protein YgfZ